MISDKYCILISTEFRKDNFKPQEEAAHWQTLFHLCVFSRKNFQRKEGKLTGSNCVGINIS